MFQDHHNQAVTDKKCSKVLKTPLHILNQEELKYSCQLVDGITVVIQNYIANH